MQQLLLSLKFMKLGSRFRVCQDNLSEKNSLEFLELMKNLSILISESFIVHKIVHRVQGMQFSKYLQICYNSKIRKSDAGILWPYVA